VTQEVPVQEHLSIADRAPARSSRVRIERGLYERRGRLEIQTYVDGKVVWKQLPEGTSLARARKAREAARVDIARGDAVSPSKATLASVAEAFFEEFESKVATGEKAERTLELYRQRWSTHLDSTLGPKPVQSLRALHVTELMNDLRKSGLSSWTIRGVYLVLVRVLKFAIVNGLIVRSPLENFEPPRAKRKSEPRCLIDEECGKLHAAAVNGWRPMVALAAFGGMRLSELLGLTWKDVDLAQGHDPRPLPTLDREGPGQERRARGQAGETDAAEDRSGGARRVPDPGRSVRTAQGPQDRASCARSCGT
jgi:integrase